MRKRNEILLISLVALIAQLLTSFAMSTWLYGEWRIKELLTNPTTYLFWIIYGVGILRVYLRERRKNKTPSTMH